MKTDRLADVRGNFVEGIALGDDRKIQTLGDIFLLAPKNAHQDRLAFHLAVDPVVDGVRIAPISSVYTYGCYNSSKYPFFPTFRPSVDPICVTAPAAS